MYFIDFLHLKSLFLLKRKNSLARVLYNHAAKLPYNRNIFYSVFLSLLYALIFTPFLIAAQSDTTRFAVIGDYGHAGSGERDVANLVKSWDPEFIITTGDNNYPDGAASTIDANIGQFYHNFIFPYTGTYGAGAATNRFFPTLGNHDWHTSDLKPYLDYFTLPGNERYYDFVVGSVHFFVIDSEESEPDGNSEDSVQGKWLREKLATATEQWKLVYFHHSPYSSGKHGSQEVMQWHFKEWGATAVLSGHDHTYERLIVNDFPYFVNGLGGVERYSFKKIVSGSQIRYNADFGAMLVQANSGNITFQFFNTDDNLIDSYSLTSTSSAGLVSPTNLHAANVFANEINLTWKDNSNDEGGFQIERCQSANCTNFAQIAQVGAGVINYVDASLLQDEYVYRVRAFNDTEISAYSNTAGASTNITAQLFSDDFEDGLIDSIKWNLGLFSRSLSNFEAEITVVEQNGQLIIKPLALKDGSLYNGYQSAKRWDLTKSSAVVEVAQTAENKAATIFSIGIDNSNWVSFRAKGDTLYLENRTNGITSRTSIDYDKTNHRFWRFRYNQTRDQIIFETSASGSNWDSQRTLSREIPISRILIELGAGTHEPVSQPGTAIFDNFRLINPYRRLKSRKLRNGNLL